MKMVEVLKEARGDKMKPDQVAQAITQALVQGGAQWMVATIVAFLPVLWTMTLMLHLGRPYILRVKLSRRVDDDVQAYRLATAFLVVGATFYYVPQVFAVEATSQSNLGWFVQNFTSNTNTAVALGIM
jgi:hypothetical protein